MKGRHEVPVEEEVAEQDEARRWTGDPDCPRARPPARALAPRCYGCGHLFDLDKSPSDVLCPCCA